MKHTHIIQALTFGIVLLATCAITANAADNFRYAAGRLAITPATALTNGVPALLGNRFVIPLTDIATGTVGTVATEGVFQLALDATNTVAAGAALFWNPTLSRVTTNWSGGLRYIGQAVEAVTTTTAAWLIDVDLNAHISGATGTQATNFTAVGGTVISIAP